MSSLKPEFHLQRVQNDGSAGELEILPATQLPGDANLGRRGFLGAGLSAGAVLAAIVEASGEAQAAVTPGGSKTRPTTIFAHKDAVLSLAVSTDGQWLVSASEDETLKIWSLPSGKRQATLSGHSGSVNYCAISPDNKLIASASSDGSVRLWSLPGGSSERTLRGHSGDVYVVAFTPDGKKLASMGANTELNLWTLPTGADVETVRGLPQAVEKLSHWDVTPELQAILADPRTHVTAFAVTNAAKRLAYAAGPSGTKIHVWKLPGGEAIAPFDRHTGRVMSLAISFDGQLLASSGADKSIKVTNLSDARVLKSIGGLNSWPNAVALTPDGRTVISGHSDGSIVIWDIATGKPRSYCFDESTSWTDGASFDTYELGVGRTITYTMPCGSPLPRGATCICNCVPGRGVLPVVRTTTPQPRLSIPTPRPTMPTPNFGFCNPVYNPGMPATGGGVRTRCTCVPVCRCIPVFR